MEVKVIKGLLPFGFFPVEGSNSWFYQVDTTVDFYDNNMLAQVGEDLPGSEIRFISYPQGKVYKPFEKKPGVYYDKPGYFNGRLFFIKVDFNEKTVALLKYFPEEKQSQEVFLSKIDNINLYNLQLGLTPLCLYSQGETVELYYPRRLSLAKAYNEDFVFCLEDQFYFLAWVEEGLDQAGIIEKDYKYYEEVVIKDKDSKEISRRKGSAKVMNNGEFWLTYEE
ncbi:MAG: hypothetical protein Q4E36_06455 [Bacillota bacterium]|nr:hypothetical protein [Bacillota bacterium]